jgi:hypothetical protein
LLYRQNKGGVVLEGLRERAQQPGNYCLSVKPDGTWIPQPLTLNFKVRARETHGSAALGGDRGYDVQRCVGVVS